MDFWVNKNTSTYLCVPILNFDNCVEHLTGIWKCKVNNLLGKWSSTLSKNRYNVGLTSYKYKIRLERWNLVKGYLPRMTPAMISAINQELDQLEAADFIELSTLPFASPTVCVQKKNHIIKVCIDFRGVNRDIVNNAYPMRRMEDQLKAMRGCQVFKTLDLTKGYHQLQLDESSREITDFNTPRGLFQWKVLPMGMKTPGRFSRGLWMSY